MSYLGARRTVLFVRSQWIRAATGDIDRVQFDIEGRFNPFAGVLALEPPPGATAVRFPGTPARGSCEQDRTLRLATKGVAGGQGAAMLLDHVA
jgi:hypothetical protein